MPQKNISRTLIVGLGGTGQQVICDIKKRMLSTYGEIPPLVQFLAIDTDGYRHFDDQPFKYYYDGQWFEDFNYQIQRNEFLVLPPPSRNVIVNDRIITQKLDVDKLEAVAGKRLLGSGTYRAWGRACLLNKDQEIINLLTVTVNRLRANAINNRMVARGYHLNSNNINVYVVASLAGGTGSSAILDITRLLQKAGINVRYYADAGMDHIFGMFFLPKFFEGMPNTENIFRNAYTALSELDYTLGLADQERFPPESREIENDRQDYHGNTSMGERVAYDGVFLIDAVSSRGNRPTLNEASSNVASFIASSMAADNATLMSGYVNSQHKLHHVRGKYQNYSGMGYCELRFNRQELVKHLLNRKLLECLQQFKTGENRLTSNHIAERFINENHLNEGVMRDEEGVDTRAQLNELTDAIIDMTDRRLVSLAMAEVIPGKHAAEDLRSSYFYYMSHISMIAHEMVMDFAGRKRELLQRLRNLMDKHIRDYGFGAFPDLVMHLKDIITDMMRGLEDEMMMHEEQFHRMECRELRYLQETIEENSGPDFLGIGHKREKQLDAIQQYFDKVRFDNGSPSRPTLAWLKVEMIRKGEAIAVFEEMRDVLDGYYKEEVVYTVNGTQSRITGSYNSVHHYYHRFKEQLIHELNAYRPPKKAVNSIIFADAYFKEFFEQHDTGGVALNTQAMTEFNDYIAGLFARLPLVNEATLAAMREKLLSLLPAQGIIRRIQSGELSIDELFILCFGSYYDIDDRNDLNANPQLRMLEEVNSLVAPMWRYQNFRGQGLDPNRAVVIGVCDADNNIFRDHGYQASLGLWNYYQYVSLGDPDKIAFMQMESAIPAFKLEDADRWANDYELSKQDIYTFSDKRLEDIDMLMPQEDASR